MNEHKAQPNPIEDLTQIVENTRGGWVEKNTAILIIHGIGDQLPLETLDQFGRGLVKQFKKKYGQKLTLSHELVAKPDDGGDAWFDNVLRLSNGTSKFHIDLYEYYWANYTEDQASWKDINTWLQGIVSGAKKFYENNALLGKAYGDKSIFFDPVTGAFKERRYRWFLGIASGLFYGYDAIASGLIGLLGKIPLAGTLAASMLKSRSETFTHNISNIIGDIVVYNNADPKVKYYAARRKIMDGAVKAIRFLVERRENEYIDLAGMRKECERSKQGIDREECDKLDDALKAKMKDEKLYYPSVIIAGHSLGTQVAYDGINKLNMLINEGVIGTYAKDGVCLLNGNKHITSQLHGFITFGSPLDKIVFFLRENVPGTEYIRQQFLDNYHGFKQRDTELEPKDPDYVKTDCTLKRLMEDVKWRNYFDAKDYVSGGLDYYTNLTNVDCKFGGTGRLAFTHSKYWEHEKFYEDIIANFLS